MTRPLRRLLPAIALLPALALLLSPVSAAAARAPHDVVIDAPDVYPESITSTQEGTLYVGSLRGTIYRALPGRRRAEPWIERSARNGLLSLYGLLADERSRTLFVCSSPAALPGGVASGQAALMLFDLSSGAKRAELPLPSPHAICDDITLAGDGTAYIADIANGEILTLAPHGHSLRSFARDPALKGIDGIAFAADGTLYADNVRTNQLLRIEQTGAHEYRRSIPLTLSAPIAGPDGLRLITGQRFLLAEARAGRVDQVTISADRATVQVLRGGLSSPSSVTAIGTTAYAAEGKIQYLLDPQLRGQGAGTFTIRAIPLGSRTD